MLNSQKDSEIHCKDYRLNCANQKAREVLAELGAESIAPAYELEAPRGAEVMRSRYCIRRELGRCGSEPLWLVNQNNRLRVEFDCRHCEMVILSDE